jgi:integrase
MSSCSLLPNPSISGAERLFYVYTAHEGREKERRRRRSQKAIKLTKDTIERATPPEPGRKERFLRDDGVRGLGLRVTAGGAKAFIFEGRIKGRTRRMTLGAWPDLTVLQARRKALDIRSAIARGEDPAAETEAARHEPRFGELAGAYMERHARPRKRSAWQDEYTLKRYVPAGWSGRRLTDITRADVARLHEKVGEAHGHYAANRTLALLRTMFNLARVWQLTPRADNPATGIEHFKEQKRERYLRPEEVQRVNTALLEEADWRWRNYFPLALMLGTRKSELLGMRWTDIDLAARTWRIPETKAGNSHLPPLPSPALAMLEALPSHGKSEWVFPGDGATGHIVEPAKAWQRIRRRAGVTDVRIHDLRHTLASWLVAQGFNLPLVGRALNHTQTATTARYAHLSLDPVRAALEQTAALMTQGTAVAHSGETTAKPASNAA